jgi:hypothetical protein
VTRERPSATAGYSPTITNQHGGVFTADRQLHYRLAASRPVRLAGVSAASKNLLRVIALWRAGPGCFELFLGGVRPGAQCS